MRLMYQPSVRVYHIVTVIRTVGGRTNQAFPPYLLAKFDSDYYSFYAHRNTKKRS